MRPPREKYVRTTVEANGFTLEPAIEWRDGDVFEVDERIIRGLACDATRGLVVSTPDAADVAETCARLLAARWPDRAYFVEVWQDGKSGFAQIFQPFGLPRNG